MKLRALSLANVRKFAGQRATIRGFGDGLTVVSEANEFGKSTFFDAIHALFFEKYSSSARPVKSLQPYAGGAVEVSAEVETDQGLFLVEKRFLARKSARILRLPDRTPVAQDDEAERWIAALLGAAGEGPAGLLWVRQGVLGLDPEARADKALQTETRRDLLSSVAGEIDAMTGGRRMDRVMRRLAEDMAVLATRTGRKTNVWKAAADEVEALEAECAALTVQVDALETALAARKAEEAQLERLDHPEAKARREAALQAASAALTEARAHSGVVTAARQERDIAALQARAAKADLAAFLAAVDALATSDANARRAQDAAAAAETAAAGMKDRADAARAGAVAARAALDQARAAVEFARRQAEARKAQGEADLLAARLGRAEAARSDLDRAEARLAASVAKPGWLERCEAAAAELARLDATLAAQSASLWLDYDGTAEVTLNGRSLPGGQPVTLPPEAVLHLPGIGRMTLTTPGQTIATTAARAKAAQHLADLLAQVGAKDLPEARAAAADWLDASRAADLARALLNTLAPEGIAALLAQKAAAEVAAGGLTDGPAQTPETGEDAALSAETRAVALLQRAEADHAAARETAAAARALATGSLLERDRALAAAGPVDQHAPRRAALLLAEARTAEALRLAEAALEHLQAAAPDLATCEAAFQRASDAALTASTQRAKGAERLAALSATIGTLAGNGIEERRDEALGRLEEARQVEARLARRAAALHRLQTALETGRAAAQETYFGPVQQELRPLLSILHPEAALSFDSTSLLPTGLRRGQAEEALEDLSGGTREQIAILTRLAFARLFARQGRHMPIVLDDALVYSDDDRIIKMFTALTRVAQAQQILVFSCRQLAFQDLGGTRPGVTIEPA